VIYYDQLGCGASDRPDDDALYTVARFVDEVEQVRRAFDLGPGNFYLFGHSWGGILGLEYALAHGEQLKGLMIANVMASIPEFNRYLMQLLARDFGVPPDHPEAVQRYYARYLCRQVPWPDFVERAFAQVNPRVAQPLRGTDPFLIGGELERWDRTADLPRVSVPTLVIHGGDDTAELEHMQALATRVQRGQFLLCPESRHTPFLDEPELFSRGVNRFLAAVDAG